jgi:hypothetical protein
MLYGHERLGDVFGDQEVVYDVSGGDEKICG